MKIGFLDFLLVYWKEIVAKTDRLVLEIIEVELGVTLLEQFRLNAVDIPEGSVVTTVDAEAKALRSEKLAWKKKLKT